MGIAFGVFWDNLVGRDTVGRPRHRLEQYIKMDFERGERPLRTAMPEGREGRRRRRRGRRRTLRE